MINIRPCADKMSGFFMSTDRREKAKPLCRKARRMAVSISAVLFLLSMLMTSTIYALEIDDRLIAAIIEVESGGNPYAVSKAGCIGLMQISEIVVKEFSKYAPSGFLCGLDLYNHYDNKSIGTWYLNRLKDHYGCDSIEKVLAAYNGGITRLRRYNYDISRMPAETRAYVKKVLKIYK